LLLSYLIDLTYNVREKVSKKHDEQNFRRLMEARTALDKTRPLEKKMRYQLDKLLAATTTSFATGNATTEDPLTYRPDPSALEGENDSDSEDSDSDNEDEEQSDMDDLAAARATLQKAKEQNEENDGIHVYRAPRLASMPYNLEHDGGEKRQQLKNQRMRQSELAQTLRLEYGEAPEQADVHGGSEYGRQREAARRMAERDAEKTRVEEEHFIRLTTSRKEKKERKRLMREEGSNLAAIANMGNLVRGVSSAFGEESDEGEDRMDRMMETGRYGNGKRRKSGFDEATGRAQKKSKSREQRNEFQQALYGKSDKKSKKKKR